MPGLRRGETVAGRPLGPLNLGYSKNLAEKALEAAKALGAGSLEDLLRQSLKSLAK